MSYAWTNDNSTIGLATSGSGNISFTASNSGSTVITGNFNVTPTYTNNSVSCPGSASSFAIDVNPSAAINQPTNQIVCNSTSTSLVHFTTDVTGTSSAPTYAWT